MSTARDALAGRAVDAVMGLPGGRHRYTVQRDLGTPMPDGVRLLGDRYSPTDRSGPLPVVLLRLPYGRGGLNGLLFGRALARHGFQVFLQSTRGTFGSGGQFRPFVTEKDDGLATVAWLREQSWCDGRVAMAGGSYYGYTQWAVAPYVDPPLTCFAPHVTSADITRGFYEQGAPGLDNALAWTSEIGRQERRRLPSPIPAPLATARLRRAERALPLQAADVAVAGAPVAFWRDFLDHSAPTDDFWAAHDHSGQHLDRVPPASMVTGWWDVFLPGQLDDVVALQAAGRPVRLLVGPWAHGEPGEMKAILSTDVTWLTHHLDGGPAPDGPPVRVFLQQADTWLDLPAWPPADAVDGQLHLRADGGLADTPEPGPAASSAFTYRPTDPTPTTGGPLLSGARGQADNAAVEARDDVLVFTGPPLAADLDVVGPVGARVFVSVDGPHADLFVRVCDVDPAGVSRNVVDGIRRLHPATVPGPGVAVADDGTLTVDVALFPTAYRFRAGHRVRVQVSGGAFPRFARNLGTDEPVGSAADGVDRRFRVHHDAAHPSSITLPRLG